MSQKIRIVYPIVVEGKYDKIKLSSIVDGVIVPTDGFGIFKNEEKKSLIKLLASKGKIIVLTDSDGAGKVIRSHLNGIVPKDSIINLYTPALSGKEKRKDTPSKEGILGVEGQEVELLLKLLSPYACDIEPKESSKQVTKSDFYEDGLSGGKDSAALRSKLALSYNLPPKITANSLLEAINLISDYDEYKSHIKSLGENP